MDGETFQNSCTDIGRKLEGNSRSKKQEAGGGEKCQLAGGETTK